MDEGEAVELEARLEEVAILDDIGVVACALELVGLIFSKK